MADVFDKDKRSTIMQKVRSKGNKSTELKLIEIFREMGITGWKRNYPVKGHPDFVFLKKELPFLWMVAFGTVMIVVTLVQPITKSIGRKSASATFGMIKKLPNCLSPVVGVCCESGNVSSK